MKRRVLSLLLALALLCACLPQLALPAAAATSGYCGKQNGSNMGVAGTNLRWRLDVSTGTLTITGSGDMADWEPYYALELPEWLPREGTKSLSLPDGLTSVGDAAFSSCSGLTSVKLPDAVTSIGAWAFRNCRNLKSIYLGTSLKTIGWEAFCNCSSLKSVTIPNTAVSIGHDAFSACGNLRELAILNKTCIIEDNFSFGQTLGTPGVTTILGYKNSTAETYAKKYGYKFLELDPRTGFADVLVSAYYADPVAWAVRNGIANGIDAMHFGPDQGCTRAQVVTFLWRAVGCPEPKSSKNPFRDVKSGAFYYKAVLWAVENGITNGMSAASFAPDAICTRGQVVTFLWRTAGCPEPGSSKTPFRDVKSGAFYYRAVLWAVENGITNGTSSTRFSPDATCTRGQVVTFLYRA